MISPKIERLLQKGVDIYSPETVEIDDAVDPERISGEGVVIHSGCRFSGASTFIGKGAILGAEGPAVITDCHIGPEVELKAGYFSRAVFLKGANMGLGAHVREGTILEEEAGGAHTVGLKQTILFPFVTLGSLINFCDCFMAGGTSRKDHSEVGSSYIHFNYTPNQDKVTPSLIGDVPRGVFLKERPIFMGGQGGLVGPCRLEYGTVIAAGTIYRKDELRPNRLLFDGGARRGSVPYTPGVYTGVKRIATNNIIYIGNLMALRQWYHQARPLFAGEDLPDALLSGLQMNLDAAISERIKRLGLFCRKQEGELNDRWIDLEGYLGEQVAETGDLSIRDAFLEHLQNRIGEAGKDYIPVIQGLDSKVAEEGSKWLQGIVENVTFGTFEIAPVLGAGA